MNVCFRKNNFNEISKYIPVLFIGNIHRRMKSKLFCWHIFEINIIIQIWLWLTRVWQKKKKH